MFMRLSYIINAYQTRFLRFTDSIQLSLPFMCNFFEFRACSLEKKRKKTVPFKHTFEAYLFNLAFTFDKVSLQLKAPYLAAVLLLGEALQF